MPWLSWTKSNTHIDAQCQLEYFSDNLDLVSDQLQWNIQISIIMNNWPGNIFIKIEINQKHKLIKIQRFSFLGKWSFVTMFSCCSLGDNYGFHWNLQTLKNQWILSHKSYWFRLWNPLIRIYWTYRFHRNPWILGNSCETEV